MVSTQPRVNRFIEIVQSEYREMPGLQLTRRQMQRFLGIDVLTCEAVIDELERQRFLRRTPKDVYVLHS
jgi:hypothetical protein